MRKVLILGAGGTGARVINRVRELIEWRDPDGNTIDKYSKIKYYEIDTDPKSGEVVSTNFKHLNVSRSQADLFSDQIKKESRHQWADQRLIREVHDGAQGTRMIGKFCFLCHYDDIKQEIERKLVELYQEPDEANQSKMIYIICNSASGTGSGCFIDYGYLVKSIIQGNRTYRDDTALRVTLLLTLPEANCNDDKYNRNSYFALQDLNHYMSDNQYEIEHPSRGMLRPPIPIHIKPFDYIYLVGPQGPDGENRGGMQTFKDLEHVIGDYVYNDISSITAAVRDGARNNMNGWLEREDSIGYVTRYMTFGFATIEYPVMQIAKSATFKSIGESLNTWLEGDDREFVFDHKKIFLEMGGERKTGTIFHELLKTIEIETHNNASKRIDVDKIFGDLKKRYFQRFEENKNDVRQIELLMSAIDNCFPDGKNENDENYDIVTKVISENSRRLSSETSGWSYTIKNELLDIMFQKKQGITRVMTHLGDITQRIMSINGVNNKEYTMKGDAITSKRDNIKRVKSDVFCTIGGFDRASINISYTECKTLINNYIKARLDNEAVTAAKKLIEDIEIEATLKNFKEKIDVFKKNIQEWRDDLFAQYANEISFVPLNGYIVQKDNIAMLANDAISKARTEWITFVNSEIKETFKKRLLDKTRITTIKNVKGGEEKYIVFPNDKEKIIKEERKIYRSQLINTNIIDEFLDEVNVRDINRPISTIREVYEKSKLFLDWAAIDNYAEIERPILSNKWFFYTGGTSINQAVDATEENNRFAAHLNDNRLINRWQDESESNDNTLSILILQERGGIPIRYLRFIHEDGVREAVQNANEIDNVADLTFLSRKDVTFLPILLIDGRRLNTVKVLFAISIVTGSLTLNNNKWESERQRIFNPPPPISLPFRYKNAVYKLCENDNDRTILSQANEQYINENRCNFIERLHNFLNEPNGYNGYGLVLDEKEKRELFTQLQIEIMRSPYYTEWSNAYPDFFGTYQSKLKFVADDEINDKHPNPGSYCTICGRPVSPHPINDMEVEFNLLLEHPCSR